MTKELKKEVIIMRVTKSIKDKLRKLSEDNDVSINHLVLTAIKDFLGRKT